MEANGGEAMETDDKASALHRVSATGIYDAIEAIYIEAHDAKHAPLEREKLEKYIDELEAMAGAKPEQRTLYTTDDSEVEPEKTATLLAWEDKEDVHVKALQELLGNPTTKSRTVGTWTCVTEPHGLTSMWTAATGEKVLVYAAGEGGRVVGWHTEAQTEEVESVSANIERAEVIKVLSRKLGVLPRDPVNRMTVLRAQQDSIIQALTIAEGGDPRAPRWMEFRHPKLMASATGHATTAAQSAQYTLMRTQELRLTQLSELRVNVLDEMQRQPKDAAGQLGAIDKDKLLLVKGAIGGKTGRAYLSFEEATGTRPAIAIMGMHLCIDDKVVRNHEEGAACAKAMRRRVRPLPAGLRQAETLLRQRLAIRRDEECPLFMVWSVKNKKLSPCEGGRGCRGSLGTCKPGRYQERGMQLPQDVLAEREKYDSEESAAQERRMTEQIRAEQAVAEAHVGAKRTAEEAALTSPTGPRRSPRRDGKGGGGKGGEARGGGGKGVGGKGGGGKGNGQPFQVGSNGGRGTAAPSAKPPSRFGIGGGRGAAAPSATATLSSQEAAERPAAKRAEEAGENVVATAATVPESDAVARYLLGLPPTEETAEGGAAAQAAASGAPAGENVTSKEATGGAALPQGRAGKTGGAAAAASEELEEDDEMEEEDEEEALDGVPPEVLGAGASSPSPTDMELYTAVMEEEGKKSAGRSSNGKKGTAGPGSAGAGGKPPPTPIPMLGASSIAKTRKSSPRNNKKGK
jgi:hypothetical protein